MRKGNSRELRKGPSGWKVGAITGRGSLPTERAYSWSPVERFANCTSHSRSDRSARYSHPCASSANSRLTSGSCVCCAIRSQSAAFPRKSSDLSDIPVTPLVDGMMMYKGRDPVRFPTELSKRVGSCQLAITLAVDKSQLSDPACSAQAFCRFRCFVVRQAA
jgi:hypothetical protein